MAITLKTGLFNTNSYDKPDRRYDSFDFVRTATFKHDGYIAGNGGEFFVSVQSGLTMNIGTGVYSIEGHYIENETNKTVQLSPTTEGNERYDLIVVGVSRNSTKTIDGQDVSRNGYIRVIEGNQAEIDSGIIPTNIELEEFTKNSGTKEIVLAIAKVVGGSVSELTDKRLSTTTEELKTYARREIKEDGTISLKDYSLQSQGTIESDGFYTGNVNDILNKFIELQIPDTDLELKSIDITINGKVVSLELKNRYYREYYFGDSIHRFQIISENSQLYLFHESQNNATDYFLQLGHKREKNEFYLIDPTDKYIKEMDGLTSGEYNLKYSYSIRGGKTFFVNMLTDSPTKSFWIEKSYNNSGAFLFEVDINGNGSNTLIDTQDYEVSEYSITVFWKGYIFSFSSSGIQMISQNGDIIKTLYITAGGNHPFFVDGDLFYQGGSGTIYSITINSNGTSFERKLIEVIEVSSHLIMGHGVSFKNGTLKVDGVYFSGWDTTYKDGYLIDNFVTFKQRGYGRGY